MTEFIFANNVNTTLSAAASSSSTTLSVSSTSGLPASVPTGFVLAATLNDAATGAVFEVVYITAIAGSNLTVIRAQEGTGAQSWNTGDHIYCSDTAGVLGGLLQQYQGIGTNGQSVIGTSQTLATSTIGQIVFWTGSAAGTLTLPLANSVAPFEGKIAFRNIGSAPLTIAAQGGDGLDMPVTVIQVGQSAALVSDGSSAWRTLWNEAGNTSPVTVGAATTSAEAINLGQLTTTIVSGVTIYKMPTIGGTLVVQNGVGTLPNSGQTTSSVTVTVPEPLTNMSFAAAQVVGNANSVNGYLPSCSADVISPSQFVVNADTLTGASSNPIHFNQPVNFNWFSIGYYQG